MNSTIETFERALEGFPPYRFFGRVTAIQGMLVEIGGADSHFSIGGRCIIHATGGRLIPCEVVGFRDGRSLVLPLGTLDGIGLGCRAEIGTSQPAVYPSAGWLGRVVNALGSRSTARGRSTWVRHPFPCATRRRPPTSASAWGERSISGCAPSTRS